jgi:PAS domain S-box-containing protein
VNRELEQRIAGREHAERTLRKGIATSKAAFKETVQDRGEVVGASTIARDITERRRTKRTTKESLATSEATFKELADQKFALDQHAIVAVTDVQGTITYVNEKFCVISQYSKDELIGKNHRILNSGHHSKEFFQQMYYDIANGKVWHGEIKNRAKDGSIYWVDTAIVPFVGADGKPWQYVAIRADITERKLAEQEIRKLNDELEHRVAERTAQLESASKELADQKFALDQHASVSVTDQQGTILYVNDKFCELCKYFRKELIGQNHRIVKSGHHPTEFFQQMYRDIANGKVWRGEIKNRAKDGSLYWVSTTIVSTSGAEGKPHHYVAIRADITARKLAEEVLAKQALELSWRDQELARSNVELEQFAYAASHDLQEPLRMIANYTQLLAERYRGKLDEQADKYIAYSVDGALRMQALIKDLLKVSQVGKTESESQTCDCSAAVEEALKNLQAAVEESGAVVNWNGLPTVMADRSQLTQVFQNLISNAIKFHGTEAPVIQIDAEQKNSEWLFAVSDNGIGIPAESWQDIFVIFRRLHTRAEYAGNGIGLSICKKIVERHGGKIWIEAQATPGCRFNFTLPAEGSKAARAANA